MAYLNKELKDYYFNDFQKLISYQEDPFWAIDQGLEIILNSINMNSELQSIYSKKFQAAGLAEDNISYLRLAFTEEFKKPLTSILIRLVNELDGYNSEVIIREESELDNQIFEEGSSLACKNNPNYFKVNHFYIALKSDNAVKHEAFWDFLHSELTKENT